MTNHDYPMYDLDKIERQAHKMRAEMMKSAFTQLKAWIKSRFSARPAVQAHTA